MTVINPATKTVKVGQMVDTQHVDTLLSNYKKERWADTCERLGRTDSLSVWYSMETLQDFLRVSNEHGADGVRMYFGVYPEGGKYAGFQTIVLVATKNKPDANGNIVTKHIYRQTENGMQLLAFNTSLPCPTWCNPDDMGGDDGSGFPYIIDGGIGLTIIDNEKGMRVM